MSKEQEVRAMAREICIATHSNGKCDCTDTLKRICEGSTLADCETLYESGYRKCDIIEQRTAKIIKDKGEQMPNDMQQEECERQQKEYERMKYENFIYRGERVVLLGKIATLRNLLAEWAKKHENEANEAFEVQKVVRETLRETLKDFVNELTREPRVSKYGLEFVAVVDIIATLEGYLK